MAVGLVGDASPFFLLWGQWWALANPFIALQRRGYCSMEGCCTVGGRSVKLLLQLLVRGLLFRRWKGRARLEDGPVAGVGAVVG